MARLQTVLTLSLLCLFVSAHSHAQDLPEVDVDALMEQVNTLASEHAYRFHDRCNTRTRVQGLAGMPP